MNTERSSSSSRTRNGRKPGRLIGAIGVSLIALIATACGSSGVGSETSDADTEANTVGTEADDTQTTGAAPSGESADLPETGDVTIEGEALPTLNDPNSDPAEGTAAPRLSGTDLSGNPIAIEADGRPKVIYFVAHWCPHCQREVPVIQGLINDGKKPDGLDVYAVSTAIDETRDNFPPSAWLTTEGFQPPTMRDDADSSALTSYGAGGFPFAVYLNGNNQVIRRTSGELGPDRIVLLWEETAAS